MSRSMQKNCCLFGSERKREFSVTEWGVELLIHLKMKAFTFFSKKFAYLVEHNIFCKTLKWNKKSSTSVKPFCHCSEIGS